MSKTPTTNTTRQAVRTSDASRADMDFVLVADGAADERLYEGADDPLTPERLARMKMIPRSKTLRRALGLTQEEFAQRYRIPIGTLRDWEQGRTQPDAPSRAYLKVIAKNPDFVRDALMS